MLPDFSFLMTLLKPAILVGTLSCTPTQAPNVIFNVKIEKPRVTHNLNHQQLSAFKTGSQFSHRPDEIFITGGITESNIDAALSTQFKLTTQSRTRETCVHLSELHVTLTYAPVVHIALNYPQGSCRFNSTWEHELKHVNTDVITLNEFSNAIKQAAIIATTQNGAVGPIAENQATAAQNNIATSVSQAIRLAFDVMDKTRMQRQQLVDTREEYMRLTNLCVNER